MSMVVLSGADREYIRELVESYRLSNKEEQDLRELVEIWRDPSAVTGALSSKGMKVSDMTKKAFDEFERGSLEGWV